MKFEQYIFNQGEVINKKEVPIGTFEKYRAILPEQVIELWKTYGFSGISKGLITLENPDDFKYFKKDWLQVNEVLSLTDQEVYLVARSAFGDLMFFVVKEDGKSYFALLNVLNNEYQVISTPDKAKFFRRSLNDDSFVEEYFSESLFNECYAKLGAIEEGECYGFVPLPVLGGDKTIEYAQKVKMTEYLSICAQSQF